MRTALRLIEELEPDLEVEGEMHADAALSKPLLDRVFPGSRLTAEANLLVMPTLDAANITFNALKIVAGEGISVGPILLGAARPAHVLTPTSTVRRIVNMTALCAVDAEAADPTPQDAGERPRPRRPSGRVNDGGTAERTRDSERRSMATGASTVAGAPAPQPPQMVPAPLRAGARRDRGRHPPRPLLPGRSRRR